jgi:hypothetical protein
MTEEENVLNYKGLLFWMGLDCSVCEYCLDGEWDGYYYACKKNLEEECVFKNNHKFAELNYNKIREMLINENIV